MRRRKFTLTALGAGMAAPFALGDQKEATSPALRAANDDEYREAIRKTAAMVSDTKAQALATKHGLDILNVTWEDTGRFKESAVGPNISDMTIQVASPPWGKGKAQEVTCMPVVRHPNFSDKSCDLDPRDFTLLVGNQKGGALKRISLYEFLEHPTRYLHDPESWKTKKEKSLLCDRDGKVLVSAQACFLPVPKKGKATFNPVLFNYQSYEGDPAVLTVLSTREGTSVTVIDNTRDAFDTGSVWGQRLFHNEDGQRASLTGTRESEFLAAEPGKTETPKVGGEHSPGEAETGLNMVLLIQIPLKQKNPMPLAFGGGFAELQAADGADPFVAEDEADVENAVIGHGDLEGPFTEIDGLGIERDPKFPVRVTVQFYKATSNGIVGEEDMRQIAAQIDRVYKKSDYVGSLVTGGATARVTEYEGAKIQPPGWWEGFWQRHEANTGDTREEAIAKLVKLLGKNYPEQPVCELYLRDLLKG